MAAFLNSYCLYFFLGKAVTKTDKVTIFRIVSVKPPLPNILSNKKNILATGAKFGCKVEHFQRGHKLRSPCYCHSTSFLSPPQQANRLAKRFVVSEEKHAVSLLVKEEWLP